jgi:hypothetical protein
MKFLLLAFAIAAFTGCAESSTKSTNSEESLTKVSASGDTTANTVADKVKHEKSNFKEAYVRFGIPNNTDDEWNGDAILSLDVLVDLEDGSAVKGHGEHRNDDLKRGRAFSKPITFDHPDKIEDSKIKNVKLTVNAKSGKNHGPFGGDQQAGETTRFRAEVVFVFNDGRVLSTGYNEPPMNVVTGNVSVVAINRKPPYYNTVTLVEPVQ